MPGFPALSAGATSGAGSFPVAALLNSLLCPGVVVASLILCATVAGEALTGHYLALCVLAFLISSQVFDDIDLFLPWDVHERARVAGTIVASWTTVVAILLALGYATRLDHRFDADLILGWFAVTPFILLATIKASRAGVRRLVGAGSATRSAVIVGANHLARVFAARLQANPYLGIDMHGYFDDRPTERIGVSERLRGAIADVPEYVRRHGIQAVYITLPMTAQSRVLRLIQELRDTTASVYFLPDMYAFDLMHARFDYMSGMPVAAIRETPFHGLNRVVKRAMDLALGAAICTVTAPLMIVIAAAVKLDSPGPVLFRQRRYGMDGREIVVLKFRSMTVCEDGDKVVQATRDDARVTRLGAFLRRTSLDELPQFFNVLDGSMSVVGPRPHAVSHNEQYRGLIPGYMLRHKAKPGITGWAQINGLRGETESVEKMQRRVNLDLQYLNNWSPALDLWIVIRTIAVVWKDRHAY